MDENSPWMCHICDRTSTSDDAVTCSECYKLSCRSHVTTATVYNQHTSLYELVLICAHCHIRKHL